MRFQWIPICILAIALLFSANAKAQCGAKRSTCSGCHDGARAAMPAHGAWHDDHAFADLCTTCHGGNGDSDEISTAHEGLGDPLGNGGAACASCHGADTERFVARYQTTRLSDAGSSDSSSSMTRIAKEPRPSPHGERNPNLVLTGLTLGFGVFGLFFILRNERRRS